MRLEGTCLGDIEVEGEKIITVPEGILGFQNSKRYVILDHNEDSPFKWLQSVDEPEVTFVIINPLFFKADYCIQIYRNEISVLEPFDSNDILIMVIVTIQKDSKDITANLQGPLIINPKNQLAKQVVLANNEYTTRHSIMPLYPPQENDLGRRSILQTM